MSAFPEGPLYYDIQRPTPHCGGGSVARGTLTLNHFEANAGAAKSEMEDLVKLRPVANGNGSTYLRLHRLAVGDTQMAPVTPVLCVLLAAASEVIGSVGSKQLMQCITEERCIERSNVM